MSLADYSKNYAANGATPEMTSLQTHLGSEDSRGCPLRDLTQCGGCWRGLDS